MSKAIMGAAMLAGAVLDGVAMFALASTGVGLAALPFLAHVMEALVVGGISMEAGAIADALTQNRGMGITTRQPAAFRQIIYGQQRVGGVMVYESTTGSHLDQYNMIIVLATHEIDSIVNLYLDGRQVYWQVGSSANVTRNGHNFGGTADPGTYIGPGGQHYSFGSLVYCDVRFGDQQPGDVMAGMTSNDPTWTTTSAGSPYLGGMAYIYLKIEYDQAMFPQFPEIKLTINGKNNIVDPRITNSAYSIAGSVSSGTFVLGETIIQNGTGATSTVVATPVPSAGPLTTGIITGVPNAANQWTGGTSGAVFLPTALPVATTVAPTVLQRPTTLTNGWAANAQEAAYEEGVNQGYNWGLNSSATLAYQNPNLAVDTDLTSAASASYQHTHQYAGCIWTFASLGTTPSALWLNVNSMVNPFTFTGRSAGIWFSVDGGTSWTEIYNTPNHPQQWDAVELSPTMDTSQLQVMAFIDAHDDMAHYVYDIQLANAQQVNGDGDYNQVFTNNWALIVADVLQGDQWGLNDIGSVNTNQLIAAANVCDEQIGLAAGGTEAQWTCNYHYDTGTSPGDVLQTMMPAAAGRLSRIGGEWFIWPAYWQGPTYTFDYTSITSNVDRKPFRKQRDLFNRVNGTYIAPNLPYNVAGNLYDSNGWYNGTIQNNFPFAFQPTNYPQYAVDARHGYPSDVYLQQDGGIQLSKELVQNCVLSIAQAQRAAKIVLLRNRMQETASFSMALSAWQMQPLDVMLMSFPAMSWVSTQFEITSTRFSLDEENGVPTVKYNVEVQVTDSSVYAWNAVNEELSPYDVPANPTVGSSYIVAPPTSLTLASNATTALNNADGTITPRILASWAAAADVLVTQYNIQYQLVGSGTWISAPSTTATSAYITGVVNGSSYNVQVQSQRANGATSAWVQGTVLVVAPNSNLNNYVNTPAIDLTNPTATSIVMGAVSVAFGGNIVNYIARTFTIPTPGSPTWYYVTVADPNQSGDVTGTTLTATCQASNGLVGVPGNTYIGAIQVIPAGGSVNALAGGWPAPTTFIVGN